MLSARFTKRVVRDIRTGTAAAIIPSAITEMYTSCGNDLDGYVIGPAADALAAYESLGYSPKELQEMIVELKKLREVTEKVGEDKSTSRHEHTTSPIGPVTIFNLPDPNANAISTVHSMKEMDKYFEDRNIRAIRKYNPANHTYTFTLSYAGTTHDYFFAYPESDNYSERCKKMTKFCEGAYDCFDKYVKSQVRVTYMPARQNGKSLRMAEEVLDYICADSAITQKMFYATMGVSNNPEPSKFVPVDVIFNDPATIVFWNDGSKTVVKAQGEAFDPEKGLAMAFSKKMFGNNHDYYIQFLKWLKKGKKGPERKKLEVKED